MSFTLKDIKWAVVENKSKCKNCLGEGWVFDDSVMYMGKRIECEKCLGKGHIITIDAQSSVQLQFNREKLARICYEDATGREWGCGDSFRHALAYKLADAIIAAEKELLEVVT